MVAFLLSLLFLTSTAFASTERGWNFKEGHHHTTIHFERFKDLIVIPARLNDTIEVNLILDTGTRSVLLYGTKFKKLSNLHHERKFQVTGWGNADGQDAILSYPNFLEMGTIKGHALGVAVVTGKRLLEQRPQIDGIIGYELFVRFAVEINYATQTIHLYDHLSPLQTVGFNALPLEINQARPQIVSTIHMRGNKTVEMKLLIDTGSSLGLTLFAKKPEDFPYSPFKVHIGTGLNGAVKGYELFVKALFLGDWKAEKMPYYLIDVINHPDEAFTYTGSLGAAFLKNRVVIFDYPGSHFFFRSAGENEETIPELIYPMPGFSSPLLRFMM